MTKLTIELVPQTCWYSNVRSEVSSDEWDLLRREVYKRAGHRCEVCGAPGRVECHEVWLYDDAKLTQTLEKMVALCSWCHMVKHFGLARLRGEEKHVTAHLRRINGWNRQQAVQYIDDAFAVWEERSQHQWTSDITVLSRLYSFKPG